MNKKIVIRMIIWIVIGLIMGSAIGVYATYNYFCDAQEVSYSKEGIEDVSTVEEALNYFYSILSEEDSPTNNNNNNNNSSSSNNMVYGSVGVTASTNNFIELGFRPSVLMTFRYHSTYLEFNYYAPSLNETKVYAMRRGATTAAVDTHTIGASNAFGITSLTDTGFNYKPANGNETLYYFAKK